MDFTHYAGAAPIANQMHLPCLHLMDAITRPLEMAWSVQIRYPHWHQDVRCCLQRVFVGST